MRIHEPGPGQIAYCLQGPPDAPVLVLSNSLGTTMAMWDAQADALARRFRVLRYDTRGHGGSGAGSDARSDAGSDAASGYTLNQLGHDVLRLMDGLGIAKAAFCGISMGGLTGLWLGIHAGHRLDRLVVANSAARIGTMAGWRERAAQVRSHGMDAVADGAAARWFTPGFAHRAPDVVDGLIDGLRRTPPAGYAACCLALAAADLREEIGAIGVPTLLVAGRDDPVTTVADADFMRERIGGARTTILDASHLSNVEAAAAFTRQLGDFLAGSAPS
ncbi:3-oxoadipate enol-lactonase [Pseudoduganella albidiflava]|nr:3-oxoadipate enol-lactonase [Pseudoduganella albidiflava]QBI00789.1 3-oxoadipate enol-lactonase [Pseudoduganella albidiflava]